MLKYLFSSKIVKTQQIPTLVAELWWVNLKVPGWTLWSMDFQQQQEQASTGYWICFGQTFTVNHFYHREYIDFHRKTLKPLKIVVGNRTPRSREGLSASLRACCVLIVRSICRIWAPCQVRILLLIVWRGRAGGQGLARFLKLDLVWSQVCSAGSDLWPEGKVKV